MLQKKKLEVFNHKLQNCRYSWLIMHWYLIGCCCPLKFSFCFFIGWIHGTECIISHWMNNFKLNEYFICEESIIWSHKQGPSKIMERCRNPWIHFTWTLQWTLSMFVSVCTLLSGHSCHNSPTAQVIKSETNTGQFLYSVEIIMPLWNLTSASAAVLLRHLSNFRAFEKCLNFTALVFHKILWWLTHLSA